MGFESNARNDERTNRISLPTKWLLASDRRHRRTIVRLRGKPDAHPRWKQHRMALGGHPPGTLRTRL